MPVMHSIKSWRHPFQRTWDGNQNYEVRQADRPYQVGDTLVMFEWDEKNNEMMKRRITATITGITGEFLDTSTNNRRPSGLLEGFVVLGIVITKREEYVRLDYEWKWVDANFLTDWERKLVQKAKQRWFAFGSMLACSVILAVHFMSRWLVK